MAITAIVSVIVLLDFFTIIPVPGTTLMSWAVVLAAFAMGLAVINILRLHMGYIIKREPGQWQLSLWLLFIMALTTVAGLFGYALTGSPMKNTAYAWITTYIYSTLEQTIYGITGFYILSASYRTLRARSLESFILVLCAVLVMTMNMTIMEPTGIPIIGRWIYSVPAIGSWRGVWIAMSIGVAAISFRVLLAKEKGYLEA
jgi:hypothetical protein